MKKQEAGPAAGQLRKTPIYPGLCADGIDDVAHEILQQPCLYTYKCIKPRGIFRDCCFGYPFCRPEHPLSGGVAAFIGRSEGSPAAEVGWPLKKPMKRGKTKTRNNIPIGRRMCLDLLLRRKVAAQKNAMKRICIISLFILLASCTPVQTAVPTKQTGQLSLDIPSACQAMEDGLCLVSETGEYLAGGQTIVIKQTPVAAFVGQTTALQIKVGDWTLVFDPGQNTPFSVGMTFPNAKLYPQTSNPGMAIEDNGKKCDAVDGEFTDDILQTAQNGTVQINPVSSFDIRFTLHCNQEQQVITGRVKLSQS